MRLFFLQSHERKTAQMPVNTLDTRAPSRSSGVLLIVAGLLLNAEQLAAGPITFNTALPVA